MKIENLDRAIVAQKELKHLDQAIAQLDSIATREDDGPVFILEDSCSVVCVERQYKNGNHHPMYKEILEFTREKFIQARLDLLKEIDEL